jgi:hypothetical protein
VDDAIKTPAKVTWKLPTPLGFSQLCIDKLEMDKSGKYKLECSSDNVAPGVKLEVKSDLQSLSKAKAGIIYTGVKDCRINVEANPADPSDFAADVTYANGDFTVGTKFTMANIASPNIGARYSNGPLFASFYAKDNFGLFTTHLFYQALPELKCAATVDTGSNASGNFTVGCAYDLQSDTKLKAKLSQDQCLSVGVKHNLAKGFTLLAGTKYEMQSGKSGYGFQLNIE